ncbi:MAG TPA: FRG domain-containing protein [Flavitalea sp.]|nr:FRG domain-containing protein [Flavitalea sp.]
MVENIFTSICLSNWSEYKEFVSGLSDNWVFRGQVNGEWVLKNAIERTDFIKLQKGIENTFLTEFQRGARNYLNRDETPEHILEWLALMQHHGAPTRLLDFTRSPFIAAFFAFEQCNRHLNAVSVWAINIQFIKTKAIEVLYNDFAEEFERNNQQITETIFEKIFYENGRSLIFPVEPFRMNRRYSLQQSIFVSTANSYEPFMNQLGFLHEEIGKAVVRISMPVSIQKEVIRDLLKMNIERASLFPDLDGYALSMKMRYNSMKTPEEAAEQQVAMLKSQQFNFIP